MRPSPLKSIWLCLCVLSISSTTIGAEAAQTELLNEPESLLEIAQMLNCVATSADAGDVLHKLKGNIHHQTLLPFEDGLNSQKFSLHAGTMDILLKSLTAASRRFPDRQTQIEETLLQWSYCDLIKDDNYFDIYEEAGDLQVSRVEYQSPVDWKGFQSLGLLDDKTNRFQFSAYLDDDVPRVFYEKRFHNLFRERCLPHPHDGELFYDKNTFFPQRLTINSDDTTKKYPLAWNSSCSVEANEGADNDWYTLEKQTIEVQAAARRAEEKRITEEQAAKKRIAEKLAADNAAAEKLAAERLAAERAVAVKLAAKKRVVEKLAAEKAAAEKQAAERLAAERAAAERLTAKKQAAEKLAAEKAAAEKQAAEKLAAERAAAEKLAAKKRATEKLATEKAAAEKLAAENAAQKLAAEKAEAEKLAAKKRAVEKLAAEKATAEKLAAEKLAAAKEVAAKQTAKKLAAKKLAAKKAAAEKLAAQQRAAEKLAADQLEEVMQVTWVEVPASSLQPASGGLPSNIVIEEKPSVPITPGATKKRKKLGISGSFGLSNKSFSSDGFSFNAGISYKPIKNSYWFIRSSVKITDSDDPLVYSWGIGYDDWHKKTWAVQLNHWGPIKPGEGFDVEKAVFSISYKFDSVFMQKNKLGSFASFSQNLSGDPTLTWGVSWSPRKKWFIRSSFSKNLTGDRATWSYGFGYANYSANTFSFEYNNWGLNEVLEDNFKKNGILSLTYRWSF